MNPTTPRPTAENARDQDGAQTAAAAPTVPSAGTTPTATTTQTKNMTTYFPTDYDAINEIGRKAGETIAERATKLYNSLTTDERVRFSRNGEFPYRMAKLLIVACQDDIERQWSAEGFKTELRALKRIRSSRYV